MFGQKTYVVYAKPEEDNPLESAVFIREGFSFLAYILSFFWALYNRIWWLAAFCFVFSVGKHFMVSYEMISEKTDFVVTIAYLLIIGFQAHDWYGQELLRKGYILIGVVMASNLEDAQQRFFDKYITKAKKANPTNRSTALLPS